VSGPKRIRQLFVVHARKLQEDFVLGQKICEVVGVKSLVFDRHGFVDDQHPVGPAIDRSSDQWMAVRMVPEGSHVGIVEDVILFHVVLLYCAR
jgi:hypothetical protein